MAEEGEKTPSWSIKHHISSIKNVVQTFNASECSLPLFDGKKCSCSAISYIAFIAASNTIRAVVSKVGLYHEIPRTIAEKANFCVFCLSCSLSSCFLHGSGLMIPRRQDILSKPYLNITLHQGYIRFGSGVMIGLQGLGPKVNSKSTSGTLARFSRR